LRLFRARSRKEIGLFVGWARTCAYASSVAFCGIRLRPSGRERLSGSRERAKTHTIGNKTVNRTRMVRA
jgi:hypothetical protein